MNAANKQNIPIFRLTKDKTKEWG